MREFHMTETKARGFTRLYSNFQRDRQERRPMSEVSYSRPELVHTWELA